LSASIPQFVAAGSTVAIAIASESNHAIANAARMGARREQAETG
jgi:hypothetical protein